MVKSIGMSENERAIFERFGSAAIILLRVNRKRLNTVERMEYHNAWRSVMQFSKSEVLEK